MRTSRKLYFEESKDVGYQTRALKNIFRLLYTKLITICNE